MAIAVVAAVATATAVTCQLFAHADVLAATSHFTTKVLGHGGFGRVYSGDIAGMRVAVKLWTCSRANPTTYETLAANRAVWEEIKTMSTLRHDRIVQMVGYSVTQNPQPPIIITKLMERSALISQDFIDGKSAGRITIPLSWVQCVQILADIAEGLAFMHAQRYIHGDIKPHNICVSEAYRAVIGI